MADLRCIVPPCDEVSRADPAGLIFFHELTPAKFFEEAGRLGVAQEELQDHAVRDRVFHECLISYRAQTAHRLAGELNLALDAEQARAIARNTLVPEVLTEPAPLGAAERAVAEELYFHAIRAAMARHGEAISDRAARANAKRLIRRGERGLTKFAKLSQSVGCLVVLMAFAGIGVAVTVLSAVLVAATR